MKSEIIIQLRTTFVHLYPTRADMERVARDAGVPVERVALGSSALNDWDALLREAAKQQGMAALLDIATQEYPENREVAAAQAAFAADTQAIQVAALPTSDMHLINFARELTGQQVHAIEIALGRRLGQVLHCPARLDDMRPYAPQCVALVAQVGLTQAEWETLPIVVNPPGFTPGALCLLSELHGRMGHFPAVVRLRPVSGSTPPMYEFAEVMNLQALRNAARSRTSEA